MPISAREEASITLGRLPLQFGLEKTKNGAAEGVVGPGRGWAAIGVLLNYFLIPPKTNPKRLNRQPKMVLRRARWDQGGVG